MSLDTLLGFAERGGIFNKVEPLLKQSALQEAQRVVQETGEQLARSMGRDRSNLPYSFSVVVSPSGQSSEEERRLSALQTLFRHLATAQIR